jgi:hypothetical protein
VVVARESLPSSSEDYYPRNETAMSRMQPVQSSLSWIKCQIAENEEKVGYIQEANYSPKHSWYSGSCLTVVTWRLSGSRQLQRTPDISTNS